MDISPTIAAVVVVVVASMAMRDQVTPVEKRRRKLIRMAATLLSTIVK